MHSWTVELALISPRVIPNYVCDTEHALTLNCFSLRSELLCRLTNTCIDRGRRLSVVSTLESSLMVDVFKVAGLLYSPKRARFTLKCDL